mgnify:CR=1 FL=1
MRYRADIDGLRAVAILSVLIYHVWPNLLPGGFIGVDIFFVISGYLISLQILSNLREETFSIKDFYRRRIKRIAPALLLVVLTTIIIAELILLPHDAQDVSRSAFASVFSAANIYFWLFEDTSYFAATTDELPLLHLWSLGIEEQFYLLWPLILLALGQAVYRRNFVFLLIAVIAASFTFAQLYYQTDPSFVFYMLPSRAGELMVGALAAVISDRYASSNFPRTPVIIVGTVGLFLIAISLVAVSGDNVFPGVLAIPPTVGTAFLILSGQFGPNWANKVLANRLFVLIGLVSYSAYLWHWPMLAFLRYGRFDISPILGLGVIGLTFLLAAISYTFVEKPCRRSRGSFVGVLKKQFVFPAAAILLIYVVSEVSHGKALRWVTPNYAERRAAVIDETRPATSYDYVCQVQRIDATDFEKRNCWIGGPHQQGLKAILFGDSNAAQYVGILGEIAKNQDFSFYNVAIGSCPPIMHGLQEAARPRRLSDCEHSLEIAWQALDDFDVVILGGAWTGYIERSDEFLTDLTMTIERLVGSGKIVIILGRTPVIEGHDLRCREKAISFPFKKCPVSHTVPLSPEVQAVNAFLQRYSRKMSNVEYFDVNSFLCPDLKCEVYDPSGTSNYYDPGHITLDASWRLGKEIVKAKQVPPAFLDLGKDNTVQ